MNHSDVAQVFDTILSIPGMNEAVRIDLKISRRNVLLLTQIFDRGMGGKDSEKKAELLSSMSADTRTELEAVAQEFLIKAGLVELHEKLDQLATQKG